VLPRVNYSVRLNILTRNLPILNKAKDTKRLIAANRDVRLFAPTSPFIRTEKLPNQISKLLAETVNI
jgi:hypothetical protein